MHVEKNYVISTRHLKPETLDWIGGQAALTEHDEKRMHHLQVHRLHWNIIAYSKGRHGFFIPIDNIEDLKVMKIPADLMMVLDSIEETGGFWLLLDPDVEATPWLTDYINLYK